MTVRIDQVTSPIADCGGELEIVGEFPVGVALTVELEGEACYGGLGRPSPVSEDGATIYCTAPELAKGTRSLVVTYGVESDSMPITVLERDWPVKLHRMRRSCPPWMGVGPRTLENERRR